MNAIHEQILADMLKHILMSDDCEVTGEQVKQRLIKHYNIPEHWIKEYQHARYTHFIICLEVKFQEDGPYYEVWYDSDNY